jgi:hypothetical protein
LADWLERRGRSRRSQANWQRAAGAPVHLKYGPGRRFPNGISSIPAGRQRGL